MKRQRKNRIVVFVSAMMLTMACLMAAGCGNDKAGSGNSSVAAESNSNTADPAGDSAAPVTQEEPVELTILAAASLTDVCNEIKANYEAEHKNVTLHFSYGGSGALQTQIEEGAPADVFISAATKQMTALDEQGLMDSSSIVQLLENKVVLIVPADSDIDLNAFEEVATDKVTMIGLGEPGSVPVGQYSEEIYTTLNLLEQVKAKANYGSDVRTVLSWVETGAVDCGIVYATDAYTTDQVKIVAEAPEGSCKKVIYPAGVVKSSENPEAAAEFMAYLQGEETLALFESYGFAPMK